MFSIEQRLARLERSSRRWKTATLALLTFAATGLFMGQIHMGGGDGGITAPKLTAQKIVVQDADGKDRIIFSAEKAAPLLTMNDADGHTLLTIAPDAKTMSISIKDSEGKQTFLAPPPPAK